MRSADDTDRYARLYSRRSRKRPGKALRIAIASAPMLALALLVIAVGPPLHDITDPQGSQLSQASNAKTEEEIKEDKVKEGMMNVSMSSTVPVDADLNARLGAVNIAQNRLDQRITLIGEDGAELYESPLISPGKGIEAAHLDGDVPEGLSQATAIFTGYDPVSGQVAGSIALEITLDKEGSNHE